MHPVFLNCDVSVDFIRKGRFDSHHFLQQLNSLQSIHINMFNAFKHFFLEAIVV